MHTPTHHSPPHSFAVTAYVPKIFLACYIPNSQNLTIDKEYDQSLQQIGAYPFELASDEMKCLNRCQLYFHQQQSLQYYLNFSIALVFIAWPVSGSKSKKQWPTRSAYSNYCYVMIRDTLGMLPLMSNDVAYIYWAQYDLVIEYVVLCKCVQIG